ncbi:hypothetical protein [Fulvivirga ligni]|uniref:hypothetical protein n=1 Tax=Fulvivirga ligni TaxID=2904246 RepID=UPI001F1712C6|nr:hypothetical protein [Fulvivirga ligni]UII20625.1 hypothetical protein LVD16_22545 [Fulvivirga ligni]
MSSNTTSISIAKKLKTLTLIHWTIVLPLVLGAAVLFSINFQRPTVAPGETIDYLIFLPLLAMVVTLPISSIFYNQSLKNKLHLPLEKKIDAYFSASIMRDSFLEIPGVITCIVSYILGNSVILALILIILLKFYATRPVAKKISADLRLSRSEEDQLPV